MALRTPCLIALLLAFACSPETPGAGAPDSGPGGLRDSGPTAEPADASVPFQDAGVSDAGVATPDASVPPAKPLPTAAPVIGFWCGPPEPFLTQARFDQIAAAGFTHASNPCEPSSNVPAFNLKMLELANKAGLLTIVSDDRLPAALNAPDRTARVAAVVATYAGKPGLYGYHLVDEPQRGLFPAIGAVTADVAAADPVHPAIVNLLPTYGVGISGSPNYTAHIADFLSIVKPKVYSYDHYNFYLTGDGEDFFDNLAIVRAQSVAAKVPFWQYIQSIDYVGHRATTGPEKRWAALHTLAYGGTGVMYFTYWTPPQTAEAFGDGVITRNGTPTRQYAEVTAINKTLAAVGKYLVPATSVGVFHNGPLESSALPRPPGAPIYLPSGAPITVGLFRVEDESYALLVNRSYSATTSADVYVTAAGNKAESLDVPTGAWRPLSTAGADPVKGLKLAVSLPPGDGLLVHMKGANPKGPAGAEAFIGTVRGNDGTLSVVDSSFGAQALRGAGWDECPAGYVLAGRDFQANGFWVCARSDLAGRTFRVGNVVSDSGALFRVGGGTATPLGAAGWDTCTGAKFLGHAFNSNGFWACLE